MTNVSSAPQLIRFALSFVAASGVVLLLSGSALASDEVRVNAPNVNYVTVRMETKQAVQERDITKLSEAKPTVLADSLVATTATLTTGTSQASSALGLTPEQRMLVPADASTAQAGPEHTAVVTSVVAEPVRPMVSGSAPVTAPQAAKPARPVMVYVAPNYGTASSRPAFMPLQPAVTSSPVVDLAAKLPSAPNRAPSMPINPSGLLGSLTIVLAGVVVPPFLNLADMSWASLMTVAFLALLLTAILLLVLRMSYGRWLRRSGYVTAARSDLPDLFFFATPRLMSYVRVPTNSHHSSFS